MKRRTFIRDTSLAGAGWVVHPDFSGLNTFRDNVDKSIGIIGLDTSHSPAFARIINSTEVGTPSSGFRVTHAYPHGSRDIKSSVSRIPQYTEEVKEVGVTIVDSIETLLQEVDFVLLETNDGRRHLEQAQAVFEAGKPVFIDKPLAASLSDAVEIAALSKQHNVPFFSASSLRFAPSTIAVRDGKIGKVLGADTYSPATIEPTHPDLFWYGIHGVESLFTIMGTGCESVRRIHKPDSDIVVGTWEDGRIGVFRGMRSGKTGYGGNAFGTEGIAEAGLYEGYKPLVVEIMQFFNTGISPVAVEETLEIFAFMAAAEKSKEKKGKTILLKDVWKK